MEPMASAIVCDELRFEITGKPFIIGVYPYDMVFQSLPVTVPQLTVITTLFSDIKNPVRKFTVLVTWPGGEFSQEFEPQIITIPEFKDATRIEAVVTSVIRPVQVAETGIFTVKVRFEGKEIRARRVRMVLMQLPPKPQPEANPNP